MQGDLYVIFHRFKAVYWDFPNACMKGGSINATSNKLLLVLMTSK